MTFTLPKLPYELNALKPFLSEEQMDYHYNKHHAGYAKNLNKLLEEKKLPSPPSSSCSSPSPSSSPSCSCSSSSPSSAPSSSSAASSPASSLSLEEIIKTSEGPLFNNAAQLWNHSFFWQCLAPKKPSVDAKLLKALEKNFQSFDLFKQQFSTAATKLFGSGWCWLVMGENKKLEILPLSNADTPLKHGKKALLTLDVWEHAYYIDYRNDRAKFVETFFSFINWDFVLKNFLS